ncbi:MAG: PAS domain-containing protein [Candidatus Hydrothermarchaeales archaeon]
MKSLDAVPKLKDVEGVLEDIPVGILYLDLDLRVRNVNSYLLEKLGMEAKHVKGKHCYELIAEIVGE